MMGLAKCTAGTVVLETTSNCGGMSSYAEAAPRKFAYDRRHSGSEISVESGKDARRTEICADILAKTSRLTKQCKNRSMFT